MVLVVVSLLLALVLGAAFTSAGVAKVTDQPVMVRSRLHLGVRSDTFRAVGVAELLGALGLVLGLVPVLAWVGWLAAFGLLALMVAAVGLHILVGDKPAELAPAATMGLLVVVYAATVMSWP